MANAGGQSAVFSSSGRKKYNSVLLFPHYHDRLACDPQNFFCVYGTHEYKWGDTAAGTEQIVFGLVDAMVAAVRCAHNEALEHWHKLPPTAKQAHALRSVATLPSAQLLGVTSHAGLAVGCDGPARGPSPRKLAPPLLASSRLASRIQQRGAASSIRSAHTRTGSTRSVWREEEDVVMSSLMQQWCPPQNGPRCRIVLDIIASRKTLGESPASSQPYLLGQRVFSYVTTTYAAEVMMTFVGISDSSVTLVGRDILYPYRMTGGGGGGATTTYEADKHNLRSRRFPSLYSTTASLHVSADALNSAFSGGLATVLPNVESLISGTIPLPRFVPAPPTNVEKVDNIRLLVCFPPIKSEKIGNNNSNNDNNNNNKLT